MLDPLTNTDCVSWCIEALTGIPQDSGPYTHDQLLRLAAYYDLPLERQIFTQGPSLDIVRIGNQYHCRILIDRSLETKVLDILRRHGWTVC